MGALFLSRVLQELEIVVGDILLLENRFWLRGLVSGSDPHRILFRLVGVPEERLPRIHIPLIVLVQVLHHILCKGA